MPSKRLILRLRLPSPPPKEGEIWGDYYFANSLAQALKRRGHTVVLEHSGEPPLSRFQRIVQRILRRKPDADIILRGLYRKKRVPGRINLMWLISSAEKVRENEIKGMDHVFVASSAYCGKLQAEGADNVSALPQCTDPSVFGPEFAAPANRCVALFVGNSRYFERRSVSFALAAGLDLTVWGRGWEEILPPGTWAGDHIVNENLGAFYGAAQVVLNDHTPDMLAKGFTSNRVYDVLASGTPLVTDLADDLPPELCKFVWRFDDLESFREACRLALSQGEETRQERLAIAEEIRRNHSFDARAAVIEAKIREIMEQNRKRRR